MKLERLPRALTILGLGETTVAIANWAYHQGILVQVFDTRASSAFQAQLNPAITAHFQVQSVPDFSNTEALLISPGIAPHQVQDWLDQAQQQGIACLGELDLWFLALQQETDYHPKIIGITGTNGKTTVTSMVQQILAQAGYDAVVAGNISPAIFAVMQERAMQLPAIWVVELSSFQLHYLSQPLFDAGVVLNITQDHLDWHQDMASYVADKEKLIQASQVAILNRDDPLVMAMLPADKVSYTFGTDCPQWVGDMGVHTHNGLDWLTVVQATELPLPERSKKHVLPLRQTGQLMDLMPANALLVKGRHNISNAMAALLLCQAIGVQWYEILHPLSQYRGQPHRTEWVRQIQQVDFIDDSKGTNVGATMAALIGLARPTVLIMGGDGKGQDFTPLKPVIAQYAHTVIVFGKDQQLITQTLADCTQIICVSDMSSAVHVAMQSAHAGDQVLLSPACASWDMFDNYRHRAQCFIAAVQALALDMGEIE